MLEAITSESGLVLAGFSAAFAERCGAGACYRQLITETNDFLRLRNRTENSPEFTGDSDRVSYGSRIRKSIQNSKQLRDIANLG